MFYKCILDLRWVDLKLIHLEVIYVLYSFSGIRPPCGDGPQKKRWFMWSPRPSKSPRTPGVLLCRRIANASVSRWVELSWLDRADARHYRCCLPSLLFVKNSKAWKIPWTESLCLHACFSIRLTSPHLINALLSRRRTKHFRTYIQITSSQLDSPCCLFRGKCVDSQTSRLVFWW